MVALGESVDEEGETPSVNSTHCEHPRIMQLTHNIFYARNHLEPIMQSCRKSFDRFEQFSFRWWFIHFWRECYWWPRQSSHIECRVVWGHGTLFTKPVSHRKSGVGQSRALVTPYQPLFPLRFSEYQKLIEFNLAEWKLSERFSNPWINIITRTRWLNYHTENAIIMSALNKSDVIEWPQKPKERKKNIDKLSITSISIVWPALSGKCLMALNFARFMCWFASAGQIRFGVAVNHESFALSNKMP